MTDTPFEGNSSLWTGGSSETLGARYFFIWIHLGLLVKYVHFIYGNIFQNLTKFVIRKK